MGFKHHAIKTYGGVEVCGHPLELQQEVVIRGRSSSVGIVAKPRGVLLRNRGSIPRRIERFSSFLNRPDLVE